MKRKRIVIGIVIGVCVCVGASIWLVIAHNNRPYYDDEDIEQELSETISKIRQENGYCSLVNTETGEIVFHDLDCEWIQEGSDSLAVFSKKGKRGYLNVSTGQVCIQPIYKHAWIFSEGLAGVVRNDMVGFINPQGKVVIGFKYPYRGNSLTDFVFHNGHCVVADSSQKIGVIDTLGRWVIQPKYDHVSLSKDYAIVGIKGEFSQQINFEGKVLIDCVIDGVNKIYYTQEYINKETGAPSSCEIASQEFFEYRVGSCSGLMNQYGEFITKPIYSNIMGLSEQVFRAILLDDYSEVLINSHGKVLSTLQRNH